MDPEFLRKEYEAEWERRDHLQAAASVPLGVLTLLGSAMVFLVQKFDATGTWMAVTFWLAWGIAGAAYAIAVYMLVRSYFGYMYRRLPLPSQLRTYESDFTAYMASLRSADPAVLRRDLEEHLASAYIDAVDRNAVNNINRGAYLHKANAASVVALVFTAISAVPVAIHTPHTPHIGQAVEAKPSGSRTMTDENQNSKPQHTQPTDTKPAESGPKRPTFPQNLDVRTGTQEPRNKQ
jgi:hypothetical protein